MSIIDRVSFIFTALVKAKLAQRLGEGKCLQGGDHLGREAEDQISSAIMNKSLLPQAYPWAIAGSTPLEAISACSRRLKSEVSVGTMALSMEDKLGFSVSGSSVVARFCAGG